jgi:hypothetical protein
VLAIKSQTIDSLKAIFKDFPSAAAWINSKIEIIQNDLAA